MISQAKGGTALDAVVLRDGKELTIKGITLPKAPQPGVVGFGPAPFGPGGFVPGIGGPAAGKGIQLNLMRTNDRFNGRYQEGSLIITIHGNVDKDNKAHVDQIHVQ